MSSTPVNLREKLRKLPDQPGCYLMRDRQGRIIYIGKARSLRKRVQYYFREASRRHANPKLRGLINSIVDFDIIPARNEAESILTEGRLIKEHQPRYNISMRDDKRFLLLWIDIEEPFPQLRLCRQQKAGKGIYFGPYASAGAARATLDFTEKRFGLRKCAPRIPDTETWRHCLNDILRYCAAPCIKRISQADYLARVQEAAAFLRGERPALLAEVREQMETASEDLDFERAAGLRDTLLRLEAAIRQNARMRLPPDQRAEERKDAMAALAQAIGITTPLRRIEAFDISNTSGTLAVASMVCSQDGLPQRQGYRHFRIKTVQGPDDPRMMAEVIQRRFSRLQREGLVYPDLILADGGITQLRATRAALEKLGLSHIPTAGLAKRFEELYAGEPPAIIRLPKDSAALKALQHLRDEAHRFAISYHRTLRNRQMRQSQLDDVPGIGPAKKAGLLRHFGSLRDLAKATETEIAAAPGIGPKLAGIIKAALRET